MGRVGTTCGDLVKIADNGNARVCRPLTFEGDAEVYAFDGSGNRSAGDP